LINGAVIENGDRRSRLSILTSDVNILRLKDAIHPTQAKTPVKRVCYAAQLVLIGELSAAEGKAALLKGLEELSHVLLDNDSRHHLSLATDAVLDGNFYLCLKTLRNLIPRENRLLGVCQE
jgi:flagellar protein FlbT